MFGHDWEPAEGTIIDERVQGSNRVNGITDQRFLVEVHPPNGEPFRVEIGLPRLTGDFILRPGPGQTVKLPVDVKRQKARFDTSDPDQSNSALAKRDKAGSGTGRSSRATPGGIPGLPGRHSGHRCASAGDPR